MINITLISLANISMGAEVNACHPSVATSHFPEVMGEREQSGEHEEREKERGRRERGTVRKGGERIGIK